MCLDLCRVSSTNGLIVTLENTRLKSMLHILESLQRRQGTVPAEAERPAARASSVPRCQGILSALRFV